MASAVEQYKKLDRRIHDGEAKLETLVTSVEHDKWEQCRIVHEAVTSGKYNRVSFAAEVGVSKSTVSYQFKLWETHGSTREERLSYADAYSKVRGTNQGGLRTREIYAQGQRNATPEEIIENVSPAVLAEAVAKSPDHARAVGRNTEAREQVEEEGIYVRAEAVEERKAQGKAAVDRVEKASDHLGKRLGLDTSTQSLRSAGSFIYGAILEAEKFGVDFPEAEEEALLRIEDALVRFRESRGHDRKVTDADRDFLASIGIGDEGAA
jgi:hypothetical protein